MDQAPFIIASGAIIAALIGVWFQARYQARTARLALLQHRLECVRPAFELLDHLRSLDSSPWWYAQSYQAGQLETESDVLVAMQRRCRDASLTADFVFGPEVKGAFDQIYLAAAVVDANQRAYQEDPIGYEEKGEASDMIDQADNRLRAVIRPYVGRERYVGLGALEMAGRRRSVEGFWFDERSGWG